MAAGDIKVDANLDTGAHSSADSQIGGGVISGGSLFTVPANFFTANSTPPDDEKGFSLEQIGAGTIVVLLVLLILYKKG